ncbi:hypothetical protein D3C87_1822200 [compost metagenome]
MPISKENMASRIQLVRCMTRRVDAAQVWPGMSARRSRRVRTKRKATISKRKTAAATAAAISHSAMGWSDSARICAIQ